MSKSELAEFLWLPSPHTPWCTGPTERLELNGSCWAQSSSTYENWIERTGLLSLDPSWIESAKAEKYFLGHTKY